MKKYPISNNCGETIEFRSNESQFALVQKINPQSGSGITKTIIMNQRELLNLYQAIGEAILNHKTSSQSQ